MDDRAAKWLKTCVFVVKSATWPLNGSEKCTSWRQKIVCSGTTVLWRHLARLRARRPRISMVFACFSGALPTRYLPVTYGYPRRHRMLDKASEWLEMADFQVKSATWPLNGSEKCSAWHQKIVCSGTTVLRRHLAGMGPARPYFLKVVDQF